jgi:nitroreductase
VSDVVDLLTTLRSTGAVRAFRDEPVPTEVVAQILDAARFAPSGGNQQAWHVVVVEDPAVRRAIRDLYRPGWIEYLEQRRAGVQPWAPIGDRDAEAAAIARAHDRLRAEGDALDPGAFVAHLDEVPVLAVVLADLRRLAATDRDLGRYQLVGGASIYPFAWSILLAARAAGLGGVITTMNVVREPALLDLLGAPAELAVAAVVALGHPEHQPTKLTRRPVSAFATLDRVDGPPLPDPARPL